jgi:hypothetical protein
MISQTRLGVFAPLASYSVSGPEVCIYCHSRSWSSFSSGFLLLIHMQESPPKSFSCERVNCFLHRGTFLGYRKMNITVSHLPHHFPHL